MPEPDPAKPSHRAPDPGVPEYVDPLTKADTRRSFFKEALTLLIGGVAVLTPLVAGIGFFLDPIIRRRKGGETSTEVGAGGVEVSEFLPAGTTVDALPADGTPQQVVIRADRVDAWNMFPDQQIGSVYLKKTPDGKVVAFNTICPHLGCAIDFRKSQGDFFCPCHTSTFALDGQPVNVIPPRPMDALEVEVRDGGAIWVKYQEFRSNTHEKIPV
jgi:Rieske Fe-S protein